MARTLIIGGSGGIGSALVTHLAARAEQVTALSRQNDGLDVTDEQSIKDAFGRLNGPFEKIIVATGALQIGSDQPEKSLRSLDGTALSAQFALNAIGPALVLKHAVHFLPRDRRCVFAALSARVGSIGDNRLGGWYGYRASKAALNQFVRTGAIELSRSHKQLICVALHPGTVATRLSEKYRNYRAVTPQQAAENLCSVMDGLSPSDTGAFFDWAGCQVDW